MISKINKLGFTLIELLAVIVILGILMLVVIPSVSEYNDVSKRKAYVKTVNSLVDVVRYGIINNNITFNAEKNSRKFSFNSIDIEKGSINSPYGEIDNNYSFIKVIKNDKQYVYKVQMKDTGGHCIKLTDIENLNENSITDDCSDLETFFAIYNAGDIVNYAKSNWYVLKDSSKDDDYVTLIKDYPLTVKEVENNALDSNGVSRLNQWYPDDTGKALNIDGYGGVQYYGSSSCQLDSSHSIRSSGCKVDYETSDIKVILDNWTNNALNINDLKALPTEDSTSVLYKSRLVTYNELNDLGCTQRKCGDKNNSNTKSWIYYSQITNNRDYSYWTMTKYQDEQTLWLLSKEYNNNCLSPNSRVNNTNVYQRYLIRPVINLYKYAI